MLRIVLLLSMVVAATFAAASLDREAPPSAESVVLLHGLGRTERAMRPLEERLTEAGYRVHNVSYASTEKGPEALVRDVGREVARCCAAAPAVHFVGHSLGGILIRAYLAEAPPTNAGRVVMLGPPNKGSELVDKLGEWSVFQWVLGPTAEQLGTDPDSLPNRLPPPTVELGVIAGTGTVSPLASAMIPGEDDGKVAISRTAVQGMTDFITVSSSHTFMMRSADVAGQVIYFLRHGKFRHHATAK